MSYTFDEAFVMMFSENGHTFFEVINCETLTLLTQTTEAEPRVKPIVHSQLKTDLNPKRKLIS